MNLALRRFTYARSAVTALSYKTPTLSLSLLPTSTSTSVSTRAEAEAKDTPDWQGGGIQMRRAVPAKPTRDARFSGGIVYRYGGAIDFDSVAASVVEDRAIVARWAPGDDSDVAVLVLLIIHEY